MKFPRQTRIFRGRLDAAPFASVFFLLVLFLLLRSVLIFTPGIPIELPGAVALPGTDQPTVDVAVDASGTLYFDNQIIEESALSQRLQAITSRSQEPVTLVIHADKRVSYETLISLALLADQTGVKTALLATRPVLAPPVPSAVP